LTKVKGVTEIKPSVPDKLVHVKFDPQQTSVKQLVKTINEKTTYLAREPKPSSKAKSGKT
jgi:copper chaperone CopZ